MPETSSEQRVRDALRTQVDQPEFLPVPSDTLITRVRRRQFRNGVGIAALVLVVGLVGIRALPLATHSTTPAHSPVPAPRVLSGDGKLAFTIGNRLYLIGSDGTGQTPVAHGCLNGTCGIVDLAWSPDGAHMLFADYSEKPVSSGSGAGPLYIVGADGTGLKALTDCHAPTCWDAHGSWSPDGSKIVFARYEDGDRTLYVMSSDGSDLVRISDPGVGFASPSWSRDGTRIAYIRADGGTGSEMVVSAADGSDRTVVASSPDPDALFAPAWSPDDASIVYVATGPQPSDRGLWVVSADGGSPHRVLTAKRVASLPVWSPDGQRLAVAVDRRIVIADADGVGRTTIPQDGQVWSVVWSPSGTKPTRLRSFRFV